jgi:hypothetical protein
MISCIDLLEKKLQAKTSGNKTLVDMYEGKVFGTHTIESVVEYRNLTLDVIGRAAFSFEFKGTLAI